MHKTSIVVMCLLIATTVLWAEENVYFGGSVGQSFVETEVSDIENTDFKLEENGFAYKILAGARLNSQFALEGGYRSLGTVKSKVSDIEFESQMTGYDIHALGNLNFGLFDLFAKAGMLFWDRQNSVSNSEYDESENGNNFSWGFGATLKLGMLGVRAEWERFELQDYNRLSMLSVGLLYGM